MGEGDVVVFPWLSAFQFAGLLVTAGLLLWWVVRLVLYVWDTYNRGRASASHTHTKSKKKKKRPKPQSESEEEDDNGSTESGSENSSDDSSSE